MEIDTARSPEPHRLSPTTDSGSIPTLDGWIESLMTCKQLAEEDVRRLCDRVCFRVGCSVDGSVLTVVVVPYRLEKCCRRSRTCSQLYVASLISTHCPPPLLEFEGDMGRRMADRSRNVP